MTVSAILKDLKSNGGLDEAYIEKGARAYRCDTATYAMNYIKGMYGCSSAIAKEVLKCYYNN